MTKAKPQPLIADHVRYGRGEVLSVHTLDTGILAALVRFADGSERTIRLDPQYWHSSIADLAPTPPPKPKRIRKKAASETTLAEAS